MGYRFNPARARRSHLAQITRRERLEDDSGNVFYEDVPDVEWQDTPAHLTPGHFETRKVKQAAQIATKARTSEAEYLGRGNFGEAYLVSTARGPVVVKVSAEQDVHGRPWGVKTQRQNFLHEAGVANELEEAGFRIVPRTVYVELPDGWPALVREYGEPITRMEPQEFARIERYLVAVERFGWRVDDRIDLYRRRDGSVFVGDVGIWRPRTTRYDGTVDKESSLSWLLESLGAELLKLPEDFTTRPRGWALPTILQNIAWIRQQALERDIDDRSRAIFMKSPVQSLEKGIEARRALKLPVPREAVAVLASGKQFVSIL